MVWIWKRRRREQAPAGDENSPKERQTRQSQKELKAQPEFKPAPDTWGPTFRVRCVPNDWDSRRLHSFLAKKDGIEKLAIRSLAREIDERSQTATFNFRFTGEQPSNIPLDTPSERPGGPRNLILDQDFLGITSLFAPPQQDHKVDIIAISGLGGHAFGSFKAREESHMWLRDALPYDITDDKGKPISRILVYGYESRLWKSDSFQNMEDIASAFHSDLVTLESAGSFKPIVFIAHSLGGLIVKQVLIALSKSTKELDKKLHHAVYGLAFFGVPHDGMDIRSLIPITKDGPNRALLESIGSNNSQILTIQQREFPQALGGEGESEIISFYETLLSPTAKQNERGEWKMSGDKTILVTKASATHCRYWENGPEHICAINRTHSGMVKFAEGDADYNKVRGRIKNLAHQAIKKRGSLLTLSLDEQYCQKSLAFPQMINREKDIECATEGTCEWLFQHRIFKNWAASDHGLLWIQGNPGAGKSTLLQHILGNQQHIPTFADNHLVLSFFFHGRGETLQRTPLGFCRSLLHQIFKHVPTALSDLVDKYRERCNEIGNPPDKWEWHPKELSHFVKSALRKVLKVRPVWLFVDALDECGEKDAVRLAMEFKSILDDHQTAASERLHICFSCRHYPLLPDLEGVEKIYVEDQNARDILVYVRKKLSQCYSDKASRIENLITQRASGTFLWARLVVERVLFLKRQGTSWRDIEEGINDIPPDIDALYMDYFQRMDDRPTSLRLFQWICFAERPLSLIELYWALSIGSDNSQKSLHRCGSAENYESDDDMAKRVIALSRGLAECVYSEERRVVQFIHQSVKDFLMVKGFMEMDESLKSADTAIGMAHFHLSRTCIHYLKMEEIGRVENDSSVDLYNGLPFLHYATTSWVSHLQKSDAMGIPQEDILELFEWPSNEMIRLWEHYTIYIDGSHRSFGEIGSSFLHVVAWYRISGVLTAILQSDGHNNSWHIDTKDKYGRTSLSLTALRGYEAGTKLLLDAGAWVHSKDNSGITPLSYAALSGKGVVVKLLLDAGAAVNLGDDCGWTPLSYAATNGHEAMVQLLIDAGAQVNCRDGRGRTPLSYAAEKGLEAVVKLLLDAGAGADIHTRDIKGQTPLFRASQCGHCEVTKLLLDAGAEADLRDRYGCTPLSIVGNNRQAVAKLLLDAGAQVNSKNKKGMTPLSMAAAKGLGAVVKQLLDAGAEVDIRDADGQTPLLWAAKKGEEDVAKQLLDAGAAVDIGDSLGQTPLIAATVSEEVSMMKLLLDAGAVVDLGDKRGQTPLLWASCKWPRWDAFVTSKLLLDAGARVDLGDEDGRTPLDVAVQAEDDNLVKLMLEAMAEAGSRDEGL